MHVSDRPGGERVVNKAAYLIVARKQMEREEEEGHSASLRGLFPSSLPHPGLIFGWYLYIQDKSQPPWLTLSETPLQTPRKCFINFLGASQTDQVDKTDHHGQGRGLGR